MHTPQTVFNIQSFQQNIHLIIFRIFKLKKFDDINMVNIFNFFTGTDKIKSNTACVTLCCWLSLADYQDEKPYVQTLANKLHASLI